MTIKKSAIILCTLLVVIIGLFASSLAIAQTPTTCTATSAENTYQLTTAQPFPNLKTCIDNTTKESFPCTEIKYSTSCVGSNSNWNKFYISLPNCLDVGDIVEPVSVGSNEYSPVDPSRIYNPCSSSSGSDWKPDYCGTKLYRIDSVGTCSNNSITITAKGHLETGLVATAVRLGNDIFQCKATEGGTVVGGIEGLSCAQEATPCGSATIPSQTTCGNIEGKPVKVEVAGGEVKNIYECNDVDCINCQLLNATQYKVYIFDEGLDSTHTYELKEIGSGTGIGYFTIADSPGTTCVAYKNIGGYAVCIKFQ